MGLLVLVIKKLTRASSSMPEMQQKRAVKILIVKANDTDGFVIAISALSALQHLVVPGASVSV